jgi:hypothetical protein
MLAHVARAKAEFDKARRASSFSLRHNSKMRLRTPNTMTNPCCPERPMAQIPMSRIHSPRERAGSLWRNSKLDHKCAFWRCARTPTPGSSARLGFLIGGN